MCVQHSACHTQRQTAHSCHTVNIINQLHHNIEKNVCSQHSACHTQRQTAHSYHTVNIINQLHHQVEKNVCSQHSACHTQRQTAHSYHTVNFINQLHHQVEKKVCVQHSVCHTQWKTAHSHHPVIIINCTFRSGRLCMPNTLLVRLGSNLRTFGIIHSGFALIYYLNFDWVFSILWCHMTRGRLNGMCAHQHSQNCIM